MRSAYWLGVATAVAVNLATAGASTGVRVLGASVVLYGVFRAAESIRGWHPGSSLRRVVGTVAAVLAFALVLVALLGTWGGYVMFLVAALAALVTSTAVDARSAVVTLGGMALIAAGPGTVEAALRSDTVVGVWVFVVGVAEFAAGVFLVLRARVPEDRFLRFFWSFSPQRAPHFVFIGFFALFGAIVEAGPREIVGDVGFLPLVGLCVAVSAGGLLILFPPSRQELIRSRFRSLTTEPSERSFGQTITYLFGREG
ncbi:hypothetical protein AB0M02_27595 [Actinoplanes sp. NPDC051861]|uniref:hypothetical protein n=1 Tax=Actinoplanes sp. NPDC051861 TaxID=3155170 RepID=UPI00342562E5